MSVGKCYRDRAELFIFLDNSEQMFHSPENDGINAMSRAIPFLRELLGYIDQVPEIRENVKIFIGNQRMATTNRLLSVDFEKASANIKTGQLLPYTILLRKLRGKSMNAVRVLVLTKTTITLHWMLLKRSLILEFDVSSHRPFESIRYISRNVHVRGEDIEKAAHHVFVSNILPYSMSLISGGHPILGTVYGRMTTPQKSYTNHNAIDLSDGTTLEPMTVPEITLIGVGTRETFEQLEQFGIGVFEAWPKEYTPGMCSFIQNKLQDVQDLQPENDVSARTLSDDMTGIKEVVASLRQDPQNEYWLFGWCREMCTKRTMLVVFWPPMEESTNESPFYEYDWIQTQDMLSQWDTCTTNVHGSVTLDDSRTRLNQNKENRQNWMAGSNCIRLSFHTWPEDDFAECAEFFPNDNLLVQTWSAYSLPIVTNVLLMKHLLKFCYTRANYGKKFKFFDRCIIKDVKYNDEYKKMMMSLCDEVHNESKISDGRGILDKKNDSSEFFRMVCRNFPWETL